jgi:hypothetical protein
VGLPLRVTRGWALEPECSEEDSDVVLRSTSRAVDLTGAIWRAGRARGPPPRPGGPTRGGTPRGGPPVAGPLPPHPTPRVSPCTHTPATRATLFSPPTLPAGGHKRSRAHTPARLGLGVYSQRICLHNCIVSTQVGPLHSGCAGQATAWGSFAELSSAFGWFHGDYEFSGLLFEGLNRWATQRDLEKTEIRTPNRCCRHQRTLSFPPFWIAPCVGALAAVLTDNR